MTIEDLLAFVAMEDKILAEGTRPTQERYDRLVSYLTKPTREIQLVKSTGRIMIDNETGHHEMYPDGTITKSSDMCQFNRYLHKFENAPEEVYLCTT